MIKNRIKVFILLILIVSFFSTSFINIGVANTKVSNSVLKTADDELSLTSYAEDVDPFFHPESIKKTMIKVAEWQLNHPRHPLNDWTNGAFYAGLYAAWETTQSQMIYDAMIAMGNTTQWRPGSRYWHADDIAISQTYIDLYRIEQQQKMIQPTIDTLDLLFENPYPNPGLIQVIKWWWCDALFMAPPVLVKMGRTLNDPKYYEFNDLYFKETYDLLYNKEEKLFARDLNYVIKGISTDRYEANGKPIFWSRGNGWVMGGLVRILKELPADYPNRPFYEQLFKEMAERVLSLQQTDGLWRASLLDPDSYPGGEVSGSGFFCYALAWGVNNGLLDHATYAPAIEKCWVALNNCVNEDGRVGWVQPIGADPRQNFNEDSWEVYGTGAFLLAGSEVIKMESSQTDQSKVSVVTDDGAWCWFADPRALYHNGIHERTFMGWIDKQGNVIAAQYDHKTRELTTKVVHKELQIDDHCNPSFLIREDGRVIVFYSKHSSEKKMYYRISTQPEDISNFGEEKLVGNIQHNVTYPNPYMLSNEDNKIFLFWRGIGWQPTLAISSDQGETWSKPIQIIQGKDRPYIKFVSDGKDKIHFAFTDGHPRVNESNKIYYAYYSQGGYYHADGTFIKSINEGPLLTSEADVVYDGLRDGEYERGWIWDIALDSKGNPALVYTSSTGGGTAPDPNDPNATPIEHYYHYAYFDGKVWNNYDLVYGGSWFPQTAKGKIEREPHYAGGLVLDHNDPSIVYLSRPINGVFEIEKWQTKDQGKTWESSMVTSDSLYDNVRPFVTRNGKDGEFAVLWMKIKNYTHYTSYNTEIMTNNAPIRGMIMRILPYEDDETSTETPSVPPTKVKVGIEGVEPIFKFDMGTSTSPLGEGYIRITDSSKYVEGGYGWETTKGLQTRWRNNVNSPTESDFVFGGEDIYPTAFLVNLPNDLYQVDIVMGDGSYAKNLKSLVINDVLIAENVHTGSGKFKVMSADVNVENGLLRIEFTGYGQINNHWSVTSIVITPKPDEVPTVPSPKETEEDEVPTVPSPRETEEDEEPTETADNTPAVTVPDDNIPNTGNSSVIPLVLFMLSALTLLIMSRKKVSGKAR